MQSSRMEQPGCGGQRIHQQVVHWQPVPDACPCSEHPRLCADPALPAAHEAVLGPGDHPPPAMHPSILFPNMATSFSFNHPQNCSWDFRNVSFHCVCLIMLPGGAAGLWKAAMPLKWRNGHDAPHREHLGDRVWEPRWEEQVPVEGYRINISSS